MSDNSEITIIIPIHNRTLFLPQVLEYYSRSKNDLRPQIIVADSSSDENFLKSAAVIGRYSDLDIRHLSIRGTGQTLYDKIISALEHVKTDFCVCCADDDFVTVDGLGGACEFLKNNPDFVVAHGAYISFHTRLSGPIDKFYWRPAYFNHSVTADDAGERLKDEFLNCKHTLYAVHRTNELKYIFQEVRRVLDSNVKILLFGELLSTMLAAVRGKIMDMNVFYSARREDAYYQGQHIKWPLVREYVENGQFDHESMSFKKCLVENLIAVSSLGRDEATMLVDAGSESIKNGFSPDRFRHLVLNTSNFLKNKNAPGWIYSIFKKVYRTFVPEKRGGSAQDFLDTDLHEYNDDLKILREVVLHHIV